jgi:hypothetical protein
MTLIPIKRRVRIDICGILEIQAYVKKQLTRVYPSKDRMFPVQEPQWFQGDKELTAIRIRPCIGHTHDTSASVFEIFGDFIVKFATIYALSAPPGPGRVAP